MNASIPWRRKCWADTLVPVIQRVDGQIRCAYHHWRFDAAGNCVHIPTGDKIPAGVRGRS
jgi:nitrite reductase/ring-hydroxylating ferredoxin subunit